MKLFFLLQFIYSVAEYILFWMVEITSCCCFRPLGFHEYMSQFFEELRNLVPMRLSFYEEVKVAENQIDDKLLEN